MGIKSQQKKSFKELQTLGGGKAYDEFVKSIPPMVEEVKTMKTVKGSLIIEELKKRKAKPEEISAIDPDRLYNRVYIELKQMNHIANSKKAYSSGGMEGLGNYKKFVIDHGHYIRGKYPELAKNPKLLAPKVKNLFTKLTDFINTKLNLKKSI